MALVALLTLIPVLALSFLFSGSEAALFSIRLDQERRDAGGVARAMLKRPYVLLSVLLIGNTAANVLAASLFSTGVSELLVLPESFSLVVEVFLFTLVVLLLAEALPKTLALSHPAAFARRGSPFVAIFYGLLFPLAALTGRTMSRLQRLRVKARPGSLSEVRYAFKTLSREAAFAGGETRFVRETLTLLQYRVSDIMTPRSEIEWVDEDAPPDLLSRRFRRTKHSRLVVARGDLEHVTGVVNAARLLAENGKGLTAVELSDKPRFVGDFVRVSDYFNSVSQGDDFGIVVDENGVVVGVVTGSDGARALFGHRRTRRSLELVKRAGKGYILEGDVDVGHLEELFGVELGSDEQDVAELFHKELGRVPRPGDRIEIAGVRVEVLSMKGGVVEKIRVQRA